MEQLIEDLMRLSRVNGADLRRTNINVSKMVSSIIADLQSREPDRHVETWVRDDLFAKADPQLLRIALENLIGNAWKFTRNAPSARIEFGAADPEKHVFFRSEEHTSELQSRENLVCRLLL